GGYGGGCYGGGYGGGYYGPGYKVEPIKTMPKGPEEPVAAPAKIVVTVPAGAKLTIDGYVSTQTGSTRQLVTPVLQPGQTYVYTMVAETTQNGQPVQQTQTVQVRAGQTTPVNFTFSTTPASASR